MANPPLELLPLRKAERWILGFSIVLVIAYAWLIAHALEPRPVAPRSVVKNVLWLADDHSIEPTDHRVRYSPSAVRLAREFAWMESALEFFGPYRAIPTLTIRLNSQHTYLIAEEHVEISDSIAAVEGQVFKALLKAWLYQNVNPSVGSSLLRLEVVSDFLSAVVRGSPRFGNPFTEKVDEIPPVGPWLSFAASFDVAKDGMNGKAWLSAELRRFTGRSPRLSVLSFRPLIDAILWETYLQVPSLKRFAFVRAWLQELTEAESVKLATNTLPSTLAEWRHWLRTEVDVLLPTVQLGTKIVGYDVRELKAVALAKSDLAGSAPVEVANWLYRQGAKVVWSELAAATKKPTIIETGDGELWLLNFEASSGRHAWLQLSQLDRINFRAEQFIWEGCESPQLTALLEKSSGANRVLYIDACDQQAGTEAGWKALLTDGLRGFARTRPEVPFVQIKRSAVELAIRQGKLRGTERMAHFLGMKFDGKKPDPIFGFESAEWNRDLHAYRVLGAIEAFEWIRGTPLAENL